MFRAKIIKNSIVTNQAEFLTMELLNEWLQQEISNNSFGLPDRWIAESELSPEQIAQSIEEKTENDQKYYRFPAEYSVVVEDISTQIAAQRAFANRQKKRAFGEMMIDKISLINDGKSLTTEQVDAFMSNALISSLREHLWAGNIPTFIDKLQSSDVSAFFSNAEKTAVIQECEQFLNSLEV